MRPATELYRFWRTLMEYIKFGSSPDAQGFLVMSKSYKRKALLLGPFLAHHTKVDIPLCDRFGF